jgi:hypothetical protein
MEAWQWLYLAILAMAFPRFLAASMVPILSDRAKIPVWLAIPTALGILSLHPCTWVLWFGLHVLLPDWGAPIGAQVLAGLVTAASFFVIPVALVAELRTT